MKWLLEFLKKVAAWFKKWFGKKYPKQQVEESRKKIVDGVKKWWPKNWKRKHDEEFKQKTHEEMIKEGFSAFYDVLIKAINAQQKGEASTNQLKLLETYKRFTYSKHINYIETPASSWIIWVKYYPFAKLAVLRTKKKATNYKFFNVTQDRYLMFALNISAGVYMWDYFGRNFSIHPERWIRRGEKKRGSVQDGNSK